MIPWSDEELALLRQHYPATGTRVLRGLMPHRCPASIRGYAYMIGLKTDQKRRNTLAKPEWTDDEDQYLRKNYWRIRKRTDPTTKDALAKKLKKTVWELTRRASILGLKRETKKQPDWTEEETEFLAEHSGRSIDWVRRAMQRKGWPLRTETAIAKKRIRLGSTVIGNGSLYSARELGRLIGASSKEVCSWIARGMLRARPRTEAIDPNHGGIGDRWEITPDSVRQFIFAHPAYIDLGAVDKYWFLSLFEPPVRQTLRQASAGIAGSGAETRAWTAV